MKKLISQDQATDNYIWHLGAVQELALLVMDDVFATSVCYRFC